MQMTLSGQGRDWRYRRVSERTFELVQTSVLQIYKITDHLLHDEQNHPRREEAWDDSCKLNYVDYTTSDLRMCAPSALVAAGRCTCVEYGLVDLFISPRKHERWRQARVRLQGRRHALDAEGLLARQKRCLERKGCDNSHVRVCDRPKARHGSTRRC